MVVDGCCWLLMVVDVRNPVQLFEAVQSLIKQQKSDIRIQSPYPGDLLVSIKFIDVMD